MTWYYRIFLLYLAALCISGFVTKKVNYPFSRGIPNNQMPGLIRTHSFSLARCIFHMAGTEVRVRR
jgi:hypothetical protein